VCARARDWRLLFFAGRPIWRTTINLCRAWCKRANVNATFTVQYSTVCPLPCASIKNARQRLWLVFFSLNPSLELGLWLTVHWVEGSFPVRPNWLTHCPRWTSARWTRTDVIPTQKWFCFTSKLLIRCYHLFEFLIDFGDISWICGRILLLGSIWLHFAFTVN
jgi:hypothetical protein